MSSNNFRKTERCPSEKFRFDNYVLDKENWPDSPAAVKEYLMEWGHLAPINSLDQPFVQVDVASGATRCCLCATDWMCTEQETREHFFALKPYEDMDDDNKFTMSSPHHMAMHDLFYFRKKFFGPVLVHRLDKIHDILVRIAGSGAIPSTLPSSASHVLHVGLELLFCDPTPKAQRWLDTLEVLAVRYLRAQNAEFPYRCLQPLLGNSDPCFFLRDLQVPGNDCYAAAVKNYLMGHCHRLPCLCTKEPYIKWDESNDYWRCLVCPTEWKPRDEAQSHLDEEEHLKTIEEFLPYREQLWGPILVDRIDQTRKIWEGAQQFGPPWNHQMETQILEYMLFPPVQPIAATWQYLTELIKTYANYERAEPLTLLELAVWKARRDVSEEGEDKRKFEETRITSGIDAIMEGVMPFLGLRKAESSNKRARTDE